MFTTTISVNNIYSTSSVVIVPIIWLYVTVVVVVISFSIIVLYTLISLLLVTVGIAYIRAGSKSGRCVGLTTLPPSCAECLEILEPQPPGTLGACPGL